MKRHQRHDEKVVSVGGFASINLEIKVVFLCIIEWLAASL